MNYITILDFEAGRVFQYKIKQEDEFNALTILENNVDEDYYEIIITQKGHSLNNCEWMIHENPKLITK